MAEALAAYPTFLILKFARLGRALRRWMAALLAYFDTAGASSRATEVVHGAIETNRRIARSFRNFTNDRLRCLVAAGGHHHYLINQ